MPQYDVSGTLGSPLPVSAGDIQALDDLLHDPAFPSTPRDIGWLKRVRFVWRQAADYAGYWRGEFKTSAPVYEEDPMLVVDAHGLIVLNRYYLRTLVDLKETFAHEYGHHWTMCYRAFGHNVSNPVATRMPMAYYLKRAMDPNVFSHDYTQGWSACDKEVLAEDFRTLFLPANHLAGAAPAPHACLGKLLTTLPSPDVKAYLLEMERWA